MDDVVVSLPPVDRAKRKALIDEIRNRRNTSPGNHRVLPGTGALVVDVRVIVPTAVRPGGASGEYAHGDQFILTGSGFGADARPLAFDSFDWGSPGDNLELSPNAPWSTTSNNGPEDPEISATRAYGPNTRSGMHNQDVSGNPDAGDSLCYLSNQDTLTGYVSLMHYYELTGSPTTHKGVRMQGTGGPSIFSAYPSMFVQDYFTSSNRITYTWTTSSSNQDTDFGPGAYPEGQWNRLEYWYVMDQAPNGLIQSWLNLTQDSLESGVTTLASGVSQSIFNFLLPFYFGNGGSGLGWYNDVYISDTRARVEIGNASTWAGCTKREIQNPSAWSDTSITFTVNKGTLAAGTNYLYTVDSSDNPTQRGSIELI